MQIKNRTKQTAVSTGIAFVSALVTAVLMTIVLLIGEVFIVKFWLPADRWIVVLNYAVRILSLAGASAVFCASGCMKAWQRGLLLGGAYWVLLYLLHFFTAAQPAQYTALMLDAAITVVMAFVCNVVFAKA